MRGRHRHDKLQHKISITSTSEEDVLTITDSDGTCTLNLLNTVTFPLSRLFLNATCLQSGVLGLARPKKGLHCDNSQTGPCSYKGGFVLKGNISPLFGFESSLYAENISTLTIKVETKEIGIQMIYPNNRKEG